MIILHAQDRTTIGKLVTQDGFVIAARSVLARTGIQTYRASELGLHKVMDIAADAELRLHRPVDEVFAPESVASFNRVPLTLDHPSEMLVTTDNWSRVAKGEVCDAAQDGEFLMGTVIIRSRDAIEAVNRGVVELSAGYRFELDLTAGVTSDGAVYDGVQRRIRGNHVAIVDVARCGSACRIGDAKKEDSMEKKITVGGIVIEVGDTAASVIEQLVSAEQAAKMACDVAVKKLDVAATDHATVLATKETEIAELKKQILTGDQLDVMVQNRVKTLVTAKTLAPAVVTDKKSCPAIHREVLEVVMASDATAKSIAMAIVGDKLETATPEALKSAFYAVDAAMSHQVGNDGDRALADALAGGQHVGADAKLVGRAVFTARQPWKGDTVEK